MFQDTPLTNSARSKKIKIDSFVSIFSTKQISLLKQCNDNIVKIPSHEAYNLKLIKEYAFFFSESKVKDLFCNHIFSIKQDEKK